MTASIDDVRAKILDQLYEEAFESEAATTIIKNLKTFQEATATPPPSEDEPKGVRGFLKKNSGDLIKGGTTIGAICLIGLFELKGDVIFRTKAAKFI